MKRRKFLKTAAPLVAVPTILNGIPVSAFGASPALEAMTGGRTAGDHVLVIVQMNGGNDGLNMVIPVDQYSNLSAARSNVMIQDTKVLPLNGITATGLHPAMPGMQQLFNDGKLRIVQSVGYPDPNYSHFRSTDIWLTASDSDQLLTTGWAGRYLSNEYVNYPNGYPNSTMPDPLAIQVGSLLSPAFQGPQLNMAFAIANTQDFYDLQNGYEAPAPTSLYGKELQYIRTVASQSTDYSSVIKAAAQKNVVHGTYPANNTLADALKVVSSLIAGGLKTRVYMVDIGGFDTHSLQVDAADTTKGDHAELLKQLSEAIKAFVDDCNGLGFGDRVIGMTFSEFGRRIQSNASLGTDHGSAAPLFIFGNKVLPGILGTNPVIPSGVSVDDNLPMQYDFRSVYASLLQDWFCVPQPDLDSVMLQNFQTLPLVDTAECAATALHEINKAAGLNLITNYPNPFTASTTIQFTTGGDHTLVQVFNGGGRCIKTLVDADMVAGTHKISFENEEYAAGVYYARFQNGPVQQMRTMMIMR
jgi:uncharacterized protein (DUF1501 family)